MSPDMSPMVDDWPTSARIPPLTQDPLSREQQAQLDQILHRWDAVFATSLKDLGAFNGREHHIWTETEIPVFVPPRRVPPHLVKELENQVQELQQAGVIRPSKSEWHSPPLLVRRMGSTQYRLVINYRCLNEKMLEDPFPMPCCDDSIERLQGAKYYSLIDLLRGYWQIPLAAEHCHKTAFSTPSGLYE